MYCQVVTSDTSINSPFLRKVTPNFNTHICNSYFRLGRCLHEGAAPELPRHHHALVLAHHPLVLQVALVPHQHHRHLLRVLHAEDLLPEVLEVVEGGLGGDAVDQDEALPVLHVEVPHGGELLGAGGVEYLQHALLPVHLHLLPVAVLYGGVVPAMVSVNFEY